LFDSASKSQEQFKGIDHWVCQARKMFDCMMPVAKVAPACAHPLQRGV
jgi:hypothetical protein